MSLTAAQVAPFPHGTIAAFGDENGPRVWFKIGDSTFYAADWSVWKSQAGATVYVGPGSGDAGATYLWATTYKGVLVTNRTSVPALANLYLQNPLAWQTENNAHRHEVEISSGGLAHAIGHAIHDVGNVISTVAEFGLEVNEAVFHPLTVDSSGLQLSNDAIELVPENLQGLAQSVTAVAGYGVVAGAALTAVGGFGAISDVASSVSEVASGVSGAVSGAQEVLGALGDLPFGATGTVANTPAAVAASAPDGIVHDAAQGLGEGIGSVVLIGFIAWLLLRHKR